MNFASGESIQDRGGGVAGSGDCDAVSRLSEKTKMVNGSNVDPVTADLMIPDLLGAYPHLRPVFDRYGLRGCGGPLGPAESIGYFAKAHGVDDALLVKELNAALRDSSALPQSADAGVPEYAPGLGDVIYRRFFKAALVVVMTAGAVWGALLLLRIGFKGSFTAISIHEINAHGHAQIFGWVGLFVMGFAYQALPRIKHTDLWRPGLANLSFYLMVFGVFARALGEPLFTIPMFRGLALAANTAEIVAIGLFCVIIMQTFRRSGKAYDRQDAFIIASLGFFLVQAVYELVLLYDTTAGVTYQKLLFLISVYQAPLRDLQIHGFALLVILGTGLRMFPALFGMKSPPPAIIRASLVLLIVAVLGEVNFFIFMRRTGASWAVVGLYSSMIVLAATSITLTLHWGLFARPTESDRSVKFVRASVIWLQISMLMLVLGPVYMRFMLPAASSLSVSGERSVEIGFSHAYFGAVRHAITVGFISLMILGMAAKVVPTLTGVDIRRLRALWLPFLLVNTGCLMRVAFQIATDFREWAYPVAGVSGLLEVVGIGVWGVHLWRIMNGWDPAPAKPTPKPTRITADDTVGMIVEWFPQTLPLLVAKGFKPLANPITRRTLARTISVQQAAAHCDVDPDNLLAELNEAAFAPPRP